MTYFSDYESTDYCYDDEQLRKTTLREAENRYTVVSYETVPECLLMELEIEYDE